MLLFSINSKGNIILSPDAVKIFPIFNQLDNNQMLFIVLAYDYSSPYRLFTRSEQVRRAMVHVYTKEYPKMLEVPLMKKAIEGYMALQYDSKQEQRKTYLAKIEKINDAIRDAESPVVIGNYLKINKELRSELESMDKEILMHEEEEAIKIYGKGSLSFLEKLLRNKEQYQSIIAKRGDGASAT